jgi:hypothetical protein
MYNRPNGQTSMAAVQGPNRHLGTQDRPRQTDRQTKKTCLLVSLMKHPHPFLLRYHLFIYTKIMKTDVQSRFDIKCECNERVVTRYCGLRPECTLIHKHIVTCYATEDAVQIVNWFYYNLTQSFIPLCHIYTAYNLTRQYSIPS